MKISLTIRAVGFAGILLIGGASVLPAAQPSWWTNWDTRIINPDAPSNNRGPVTAGQLKHVASQAKKHLDQTLPGGAGSTIDDLVNGFSDVDNFKPVNLGQLKNVSKSFYVRLLAVNYNTKANLIAHGYSSDWEFDYPWRPEGTVLNLAPATIGQLKMLFSFDLSNFDGDGDGIPDRWEEDHGLTVGISDGALDQDGDGLSNLAEYQRGLDPENTDSDYDGASDNQEVTAGTNPLDDEDAPALTLSKWRFTDSSLLGERGQTPKSGSVGSVIANAWSGQGLNISGNASSLLIYKEKESDGTANVHLRKGSIRLWIKPSWNSGSAPQTWARIIEIGTYSVDASIGIWNLNFNDDGSQIYFSTQDNEGHEANHLIKDITWAAGQWYQLVLTYSPTETKLFVNGGNSTTGSGIDHLPPAAVRAEGFAIGTNRSAGERTNCLIDEVEFFNHVLTPTQIANDYAEAASFGADGDSDGLSDAWETSEFGSTSAYNGTDDPDGDGINNLAEYQAGSNPGFSVTPPPGLADVRVVKFTSILTNATIKYSTNGGDPLTSGLTVSEGELIRIPRGTQLRAVATASGSPDSAELSGNYARAQVHAGEDCNVALDEEGNVWTWGSSNANGQLAKDHKRTEYFPFKVDGATNGVSASIAENHMIYATGNSTAFAAGYNPVNGKLGIGSNSSADYKVPTLVTGNHSLVEVSVGQEHSLALSGNGSIFSWGSDADGRLGNGGGLTANVTSPASIGSGYLTVAAGVNHALAVNSTGRLFAWGANGDRQLGSGNTTSYDAPFASQTGSGGSAYVDNVVQVSAGNGYSLALSKNGTVRGTGLNAGYQLGLGSNSTTSYFTQISAFNNVVKISAGYDHALALKADGTVWGWGSNASKQINSSNNTTLASPTQFSGITTAVDIAAGKNHSLIMLADGSVVMAGKDSRANAVNLAKKASLPTASYVSGNYPEPISVTLTDTQGGGTLRYTLDGSEPTVSSATVSSGGNVTVSHPAILKVKSFASGMQASPTVTRQYTIGGRTFGGYSASAVVDAEGQVWGFGYNGWGNLGAGDSVHHSTPIPISTPSGIREASLGAVHSLYLSEDGVVYATGRFSEGGSDQGLLGDGSGNSTTVPVAVDATDLNSGNHTVMAIAATRDHSLALRSDGTVWAWGKNQYGQLGDGTVTTPRLTPVQVSGLTNVIAIATGDGFSVALKEDGSLYVWGLREPLFGIEYATGDFEFFFGSAYYRKTPLRVGSINDVIAISVGDDHALAIRRDGSLWAAGLNTNGRLGTGGSDIEYYLPVPGMTDVISASAGRKHSLAVNSLGEVWAWGYMGDGRLGASIYGPNINIYDPHGFFDQSQSIPIKTQMPVPAFVVTAAEDHSLATSTGSTHWAWGHGLYGQIGDGYNLTRHLPVRINFSSSDSDEDGLPDWMEDIVGTDPNEADTNGNGIDDQTEYYAGLDPTALDSDGDGVSNAEELAAGTDPFKTDTDGDGVWDLADAFPLDRNRIAALTPAPGDSTAPTITVTRPAGVTLLDP